MKASPAAVFIVTKVKLLFEFEIAALDPPAWLGEMDKMIKRRVGREVGEPEFGGFGFILGPLDQKPEFRTGLFTFVVSMRRADALGRGYTNKNN